MTLVEKHTTSHMFHYMETFLTKKLIISFPLNMFLLKTEFYHWTVPSLFMAKGKKKCLNNPFSNPLRSCQNKEEEIKCARDYQNGQLKLLNSHSTLVLSAKFFNFFPPIYTLGKFKNPIVSHYGLRLSPILRLRVTVTTPSKHFLVLISTAYVIGGTGFS